MAAPSDLIIHYSNKAFQTRMAALTVIGAVLIGVSKWFKEVQDTNAIGTLLIIIVFCLAELNRRYTYSYRCACYVSGIDRVRFTEETRERKAQWKWFRAVNEIPWKSPLNRFLLSWSTYLPGIVLGCYLILKEEGPTNVGWVGLVLAAFAVGVWFFSSIRPLKIKLPSKKKASWFDMKPEKMHYRLNRKKVNPELKTIVFLHGLGESGASFREALELGNFNVVVPDLVGFGRSSSTGPDGYSFDTQIDRVYRLLDHLHIDKFFLVGHSMGGVIGTLMAHENRENRISFFVNIEGNLTSADCFLTDKILEHTGAMEPWFSSEFINETVPGISLRSSIGRYRDSLRLARWEAVLASAQEIKKYDEAPTDIGTMYAELKVPRLYCWGVESLSPSSQEFLERHQLANQKFEEAHHWPMIDRTRDFYAKLADTLRH